MPRDTPPICLPALRFEDAESGALRYGGQPRLPETIDWPTAPDGAPYHFLADIDLAALPRTMEQAGVTYEMPKHPDSGHLFFFLPLDSDRIYQFDTVVIHAPDATDSTPLRQPPESLQKLDPDDAHIFKPEAVAEDGRTLNAGHMAATPFLSARAENPLWRNMDRAHVSEDEIYARDRAYADQLNALGIAYDVPLPTPGAAREPLYDTIPIGYQGYFQRGTFQWDWPYVFEIAKHAYAHCHDLPVEQLEGWIEDGDVRPRYRRLIDRFNRKKAEILAETFEDTSGWWERYSCDHVPALTMRTDVQLRRWMGYARVARKRPMTEEDKAAFVDFLKLIDRNANAGGPVNLRVLALFREHRVRNYYVEQVMNDAFSHAAQALRHLHPERKLEPTHDFGDTDAAARIVQMFGAGYLMQHAAVEHEDKVLLFQLSNACGIEFVDGILQIWITHEDLAAARFDRVIATMDAT